jgi:pimeloyl-ACP methyl ester carboxylesterase
MAQPKPRPAGAPTVDDVDFKALYRKTLYEVRTADHWTLVITRYRPVEQPFPQPIFGEPILLVHGFSQNRHAWTAGEFVKNLLFFGADVHILELRGHGKSSVALQRERHQETGSRLPEDLDYGWDADDYFLYDLPAAVDGVRRVTRRPKISSSVTRARHRPDELNPPESTPTATWYRPVWPVKSSSSRCRCPALSVTRRVVNSSCAH